MNVKYEDGFEYACGELMKDPCQRKVAVLLGMLDDHTDFSKGMLKAIECYEEFLAKVRRELKHELVLQNKQSPKILGGEIS